MTWEAFNSDSQKRNKLSNYSTPSLLEATCYDHFDVVLNSKFA